MKDDKENDIPDYWVIRWRPIKITEHKLQNMKTIELSYDGRLIPVEEVLKTIEGVEK